MFFFISQIPLVPLPSLQDDSNLLDLDDDPEIQNAFLGSAEVITKTKHWTEENEDWLETQKLKKSLESQKSLSRPKKVSWFLKLLP